MPELRKPWALHCSSNKHQHHFLFQSVPKMEKNEAWFTLLSSIFIPTTDFTNQQTFHMGRKGNVTSKKTGEKRSKRKERTKASVAKELPECLCKKSNVAFTQPVQPLMLSTARHDNKDTGQGTRSICAQVPPQIVTNLSIWVSTSPSNRNDDNTHLAHLKQCREEPDGTGQMEE